MSQAEITELPLALEGLRYRGRKVNAAAETARVTFKQFVRLIYGRIIMRALTEV